jgi:hypothetical protein
VVLEEPLASRYHALLYWSDARWRVRDLGSRNGTWVEGRRVGAGEEAPLAEGNRLAFGGAGTWILVDIGPPEALAVALGDRAVVRSQGALLALPPDAPTVVVRTDAEGWILDRGDTTTRVADGHLLQLDGVTWRLHLPGPGAPTAARSQESEPWALHFVVNGDEDRIAARLVVGATEHDLRVRAHHRILLELARERDRAARRRDPADAAGWVQPDQLRDYFNMLSNTFYVHLFRLRQQLDEVGVGGEAGLVERRETGELRLAPHVRVSRQGG